MLKFKVKHIKLLKYAFGFLLERRQYEKNGKGYLSHKYLF